MNIAIKVVGEILEAFGTALLAKVIIEKDGKKQVDPNLIKKVAPKFALSREDHEAFYARILTKLSRSEQKVVDQFMSDRWPHPDRPGLGEHQQSDFLLSVCEMAYGTDDGARTGNLTDTLNFLKMFASLSTHEERLRIADARNFCKGKEDEYLVVQLQGITGQVYHSTGQMLRGVIQFVRTQGPAFVQALSATARAGLQVVGQAIREVDDWAGTVAAPQVAAATTRVRAFNRELATGGSKWNPLNWLAHLVR